ncbi:atpG [Symbiodinium necroappetens]|uniref:AtpG protein n=1 Tax=Symbiodinium necroappetens TaxID=1628268 RepID=A0A812JYQ1_9DINO|nr:atpG [Symbiodinium necroappetens]
MQRKAHPIPPPRGNGLEREAVQTAWKAKELQREAGKVEARGAERLARIPGTFTTSSPSALFSCSACSCSRCSISC